MKSSFSSEKRLHGAKAIQAVLQQGQRFASPNLLVVVQNTSSLEKKLGIGVSRKVGNAVKRNKIKRWIREAFRLNQNQMPSGFRVVVLVREKQNLKNFSEVEKDLLSLFGRAKIFDS